MEPTLMQKSYLTERQKIKTSLHVGSVTSWINGCLKMSNENMNISQRQYKYDGGYMSYSVED